MKFVFRTLLALAALTLTISACTDDQTYAKDLANEKKLIADFIKRNNITVVETMPEVWAPGVFYKTKSGLYFRLTETGDTTKKIEAFINDSLEIGLDGFMINSNEKGYEIINTSKFDNTKEIHYSIPYPHKYASMVNENGMMSLFGHVIKNTSFVENLIGGIKLVITQNLKSITPLALNLEVPKNLKKGSYIYMQNIITDLLLGMGRGDILIEFIKSVSNMGYKPGIITLNPIMFDKLLENEKDEVWLKDLVVCFNINKEGFNVFPSLDSVENFIKSKPKYKLMGMSIFASGAANITPSAPNKLPKNKILPIMINGCISSCLPIIIGWKIFPSINLMCNSPFIFSLE